MEVFFGILCILEIEEECQYGAEDIEDSLTKK